MAMAQLTDLIGKAVWTIRRDELSRFHKRIPDEQFKQLLRLFECSIARVVAKMGPDEAAFRRKVTEARSKMPHIVDWLLSSIVENAHWLAKTDDRGRPKKIMKCGTVDALHREAEASMKKQRARQPAVVLDPADEQVFMELSDGWRIVRMVSKAALARESQAMGNCIGLGAYDHLLGSADIGLLSLRDRTNEPHVTIDIDLGRNVLVEVRGKANTFPKEEYAGIMRPFFRKHGWWERRSGRPDFFFVDPDGGIHAPEELAAGSVVREIANVGDDVLEKLPVTFMVAGDACFRERDLRGFISRGLRGVVVNGRADLSYTTIKCLPAVHGFRGDIDLFGSSLSEFGRGFRCHGTLKLGDNDNLKALPSGLSVGGDLVVRGGPLCEVPENLVVGGNLTLSGTQVRKVPKTARIGGSVSLVR
jgi:hypothetical protein